MVQRVRALRFYPLGLGWIVYKVTGRATTQDFQKEIVVSHRYVDLASTATHIMFYASRSVTGRGEYFAIGRLEALVKSSRRGPWHGIVADYQPLPARVPAFSDRWVYEPDLIGPNWKALVQRDLRPITEPVVQAILEDSLKVPDHAQGTTSTGGGSGLAEAAQSPFDHGAGRQEFDPHPRRRIEVLVRTRRLRIDALAAYDFQCCMTGIGQMSGSGDIEPEVCHLMPASAGGPHVLANAILLTRSLHWSFDRGLIALSDAFDILAKPALHPKLAGLLHGSRRARMPAMALQRPTLAFIRHHRENVYGTG